MKSDHGTPAAPRRRTYAVNSARWQIGVALQADQPHFLPDQHFRVRRAMRHMAALAAFFTHRGVFESERPAFVAMAVEAAGLIGAGDPHCRFETAVRIMAVDARHRVFGERCLNGSANDAFTSMWQLSHCALNRPVCAQPGRRAHARGPSGRKCMRWRYAHDWLEAAAKWWADSVAGRYDLSLPRTSSPDCECRPPRAS